MIHRSLWLSIKLLLDDFQKFLFKNKSCSLKLLLSCFSNFVSFCLKWKTYRNLFQSFLHHIQHNTPTKQIIKQSSFYIAECESLNKNLIPSCLRQIFNSHTHILNVSSKQSDVQSAVLCADFIHIATETNSCIILRVQKILSIKRRKQSRARSFRILRSVEPAADTDFPDEFTRLKRCVQE